MINIMYPHSLLGRRYRRAGRAAGRQTQTWSAEKQEESGQEKSESVSTASAAAADKGVVSNFLGKHYDLEADGAVLPASCPCRVPLHGLETTHTRAIGRPLVHSGERQPNRSDVPRKSIAEYGSGERCSGKHRHG